MQQKLLNEAPSYYFEHIYPSTEDVKLKLEHQHIFSV